LSSLILVFWRTGYLLPFLVNILGFYFLLFVKNLRNYILLGRIKKVVFEAAFMPAKQKCNALIIKLWNEGKSKEEILTALKRASKLLRYSL